MQICVDFFPAIIKKSSVLKKMQQQLKHKIHSDMPALLPNPVVNFHMQTQEHISPYAKVDEVVHLKDQNMTKRSLGDVVKIMSGIVKGACIVGDIISGVRSVGGMIIDGVNVVPHFGIYPILKWCCTILEFQNGAPVLKWCCTILEHLVLPHFKMVLPHFETFIFTF